MPKSDVCERNIHDFENLTYVMPKSDACTDVSPKIVQKSGSEQNVMPLRIMTKIDALLLGTSLIDLSSGRQKGCLAVLNSDYRGTG